jgi:hypothetical protein
MALTDLQEQLALQVRSVQLDLMALLVLQVLLAQALQEQPVFKVPLAPRRYRCRIDRRYRPYWTGLCGINFYINTDNTNR